MQQRPLASLPDKKVCNRCKREKPIKDFVWQHRKQRPGPYCKPCNADMQRAYQEQLDPDEKNRRATNARRRYSERYPEAIRLRRLRSRYGLSRADLDGWLAAQGGRCGICHQIPESWQVDHDHACCATSKTCGKCVRGLLCQDCNHLLGRAHDDVAVLLRAAEYLVAWAIAS